MYVCIYRERERAAAARRVSSETNIIGITQTYLSVCLSVCLSIYTIFDRLEGALGLTQGGETGPLATKLLRRPHVSGCWIQGPLCA